jgi:hypothetical protein
LLTQSAKATFKNVTPGLSVHLQGDHAVTTKGDKTTVAQSATAGFTYVHEKVHFTSEAKVPLGGVVALTASLHAHPADKVSVGIKADYEVGGAPKVEAKLLGGNDESEAALSL